MITNWDADLMLSEVITSAKTFKENHYNEGKYTLTAPRTPVNFIGIEKVINALKQQGFKVKHEIGINIVNFNISW